MNLKKLADRVAEVLSDYKGTTFNSTAIVFTGVIQQLTTLLTFKCPCIEPNELSERCKNRVVNSDTSCVNFVNQLYGLSFIIAPAIGFFVFGLLLKQKFWRAITGHKRKDITEAHEQSKYRDTIIIALTRSLIFPFAWISLAFLDGRFLACALTPMPYDLKKSYSNCWTVTQTEDPQTSHWYEANRRLSQTLGLFVIVCTVVTGFVIYTMQSYLSPYTFYHEKFIKNYRKKEIEVMKAEMTMQAEREAKENVKEFLDCSKKSKKLWDTVSSVYDFPQGDPELALNSNLQDWAMMERDKRNFGLNKKTDSF